jgi:hypothetical protein
MSNEYYDLSQLASANNTAVKSEDQKQSEFEATIAASLSTAELESLSEWASGFHPDGLGVPMADASSSCSSSLIAPSIITSNGHGYSQHAATSGHGYEQSHAATEPLENSQRPQS